MKHPVLAPVRSRARPPSAAATLAARLGLAGGAMPAWLWIALAGASAAVLASHRNAFGFYEDEGSTLLTAFMVERGQLLYLEVPSDDPPLLTWVLAVAIRVLGAGAAASAGQLLALGFGVLALVAACAIARELGGRPAALLCAALLCMWAPFLKFATTVGSTMPALALATASLACALRAGTAEARERPWIAERRWVSSGLLLGAGATCGLAALPLVPVVLAALSRCTAGAARVRTLGIWAASLAVPIAVILILCPLGPMLDQLFAPHLGPVASDDDARAAAIRRAMLLAPGMLVVCGAVAVSVAVLLRSRDRRAPVLAFWVVAGTLGILVVHWPRAHHLPGFLVPISTVLAVGVTRCVRGLERNRNPWLTAVFVLTPALASVGLVSHLRSHGYWRRLYDNTAPATLRPIARAVAAATAPDDWVLVDRPILAYWAQRRTPPELAPLADPRAVATGALTDEELTLALDRYHPAMVVLCTDRLRHFAGFQARLAADYRSLATVPTPRATSGAAAGACRLLRRRAAAAG